jgi:hypothetical protein
MTDAWTRRPDFQGLAWRSDSRSEDGADRTWRRARLATSRGEERERRRGGDGSARSALVVILSVEGETTLIMRSAGALGHTGIHVKRGRGGGHLKMMRSGGGMKRPTLTKSARSQVVTS